MLKNSPLKTSSGNTIFRINKRFKLILEFCYLLFIALSASAQDEPIYAPKGSYTSYFRYYAPGDIAMPSGARAVSKGVALLASYDLYDPDFDEERNGTAFIIQTFRDDDTICMCTAGHMARGIFNEKNPYPVNPPYSVNPFFMYLNYLGWADSYDTTLNETISGFKTPMPIGAKLVRYIEDSVGDGVKKDIALFLIDKKQLPAVANYAMIGYDLNGLYGKSANSIGRFYQIGHPEIMPQRVTLDASFSPGTAQNPNVIELNEVLSPPVGIGPGASGSPWLIRTLADGTVSNTGTAIAVHSSGRASILPHIAADTDLAPIKYSRMGTATEFAAISADIKAHCWKNKTEAQLQQSKEYMNTVMVSNNIQPYSQAQTLNQVTDLTGITSPNAYTVTESKSSTSVSATYLKASTCTIGGLAFPASYSGTGKPWQINIMGKEVNVNPPAGTAFEYTASGYAELNMAGALVEPISQTIANPLPELGNRGYNANINDGASEGFAVWPNPSTTGRFFLAVPEINKEAYVVIVYEAASGRRVAEGGLVPGTVYPVDLGSYCKGIYIAAFYLNGKLVYNAKLVFQ